MPSTWMEMTNPMTSRCAPPCSMWSGVMIITVTIAAWAHAIATTAAPTAGTSRTTSTNAPYGARVDRCAVGDDGRGGDRRARPAQTEQEEPGEDLPRRPLGREAAQRERDQQHHSPGDQDARATEPVRRPPDHRREGEHAEHVDRDDEPDDLQVGTTVLHVERRHDHHGHHGRVGARHRHHGRADRGHVADDLDESRPRPTAGLDALGRGHARRRLRQEERVRPQPHPHPSGGEDEHDGADGEATGELGDPQPPGGRAADADEVGAGDRADGRGPHDDRERPRAVLLGREVRRGVARRAVDRRGRPQQQRPRQQHQHRVHDTGDHGEPGAGSAHQVAGDQADPASAAPHHPRQAVRRSGRAEHLEGLRQPRHRLAAGDVAGQQRRGGDTDGHPDGADGLRDHERADRVALDALDVEACVDRVAHFSVSGSSSWRHTAAQTCLGGTPASRASRVVRPSRSRTTVISAHVREYARPSAWSSRDQNSVCLGTPHHEPPTLQPGLPTVALDPGAHRHVRPPAGDDLLQGGGSPVGEVAWAADRPMGGPALAVTLLERDPEQAARTRHPGEPCKDGRQVCAPDVQERRIGPHAVVGTVR